MIDDPLSRLKRPAPRGESPPNGQPAPEHQVAPAWVGECVRLAGEAWNPSLILSQRDGQQTAISYTALTAVRLDPSASIELDFQGYAVTVVGRRLNAVFDALASQRCMELAESPSNVDEDESAPFIETIAIVATQER